MSSGESRGRGVTRGPGQVTVVSGLSGSVPENEQMQETPGPPENVGENFLHRPRPRGNSARPHSPCPGPSPLCPSGGPCWAHPAGLDRISQLTGYRKALSLHSSSWGLEHQGPPVLVASLFGLAMPRMDASPPPAHRDRVSCCWQESWSTTGQVATGRNAGGEEGSPRLEEAHTSSCRRPNGGSQNG